MSQRETDATSNTLLSDVIAILRELTSDWDLDFEGTIGPETSLIRDLAFESVDVVHFMVAIQERYGRFDLPFEDLLLKDGRYVSDLRVGQVVDFLRAHVTA